MQKLENRRCITCKMPMINRNGNTKYCNVCIKIHRECNRSLSFLEENYWKLSDNDRWKLLAVIMKLTFIAK